MIVCVNVLHFVKICQVLMILHQLICRGVANFGTQCSYANMVTFFHYLCFNLLGVWHSCDVLTNHN